MKEETKYVSHIFRVVWSNIGYLYNCFIGLGKRFSLFPGHDKESEVSPPSKVAPDALQSPSYDIGSLTGDGDISDEWKIFIAENAWKPPTNFVWPTSSHKKCHRVEYRKISEHHLHKYPWLAYSESDGGFFCRYCRLFAPTATVGSEKCGQLPGQLVKTPLRKYNKLSGKDGALDKHAATQYHMSSIQAAQHYIQVQRNQERDIRNVLSAHRDNQVQQNRYALLSIIKAVILCGAQCLPLRGHLDSGRLDTGSSSANEGNFRALLRYRIDGGDKDLERHLKEAPKNAVYTSPHIQNEVINVAGQLIQKRIVDRINQEGGLYSILADETQDISTVEQLSICLRYIAEGAIHEDFIGFWDIMHESFSLDFNSLKEDEVMEPKLSGRVIGKAISDVVEKMGLDIDNCVGQGYDGASTMSSETKGAAAVILEKNPRALYTHCASHSLNLAVVGTCKLQAVRNMYGTVLQVINFINASAKRVAVFGAAVTFKYPQLKNKRLKQLCETRWVERHEALDTFIELYDAIILTLDQISKWNDVASSSKSRTLLLATKNPMFLIALHCTADIMSNIRPLAVKLQTEDQDMLGAVSLVQMVIDVLEQKRTDTDTEFGRVYSALSSYQQTRETPRICTRQDHRSNPAVSDMETYYRTTVYIPLLDEIITNVKSRFTRHVKQAMQLSSLIPSNIVERATNEDDKWLSDAIRFYSDVLPETTSMQSLGEWKVWRQLWLSRPQAERPRDAVAAFTACDRACFPTIRTLLHICACQPVTSAAAERSFSTLRRLKTWTRSTMGESRLTGLALMNCHPQLLSVEDAELVLEMFARRKARRLNLLL